MLKKGRPPHGWGVGIYGYDYIREIQTRIINESEAFIVRRTFESCVGGESYFQIAERLHKEGIPTKANKTWHGLTIRRILHNQTYTGLDVYGKMRSYAVPGGKRKGGHVNMCVNVIRRQPSLVSVQRRFRSCRRHLCRRPSSVPAPSASGTCSPPPAASSRSQLSPCPPS